MRTITSITSKSSVIKAIEECERLGIDTFLTKYGYKPSRSYFLLYQGAEYPSKAIVGVAFKYEHSGTPLGASEFSGGEATVKRLLERLGFQVITRSVDEQPEHLAEEVSGNYWEGNVTQIIVNKYERSRAARKACIEIHGTACIACKTDLGKLYGKEYEGFIHVHHTKLISSLAKEYKVNPKEDLVPICPNCHAIIHFSNKPLSIKELKAKLSKAL
ncbi:TPA: hypothetical protein ACGUVO_004557 [Vibrio vulnificus]|nr:HNH endonuclease [Vibrio vulnificus]